MKKKFFKTILLTTMVISLVGCSSMSNSNIQKAKFEKINADLKVGMVTDSGSINDKSFNQGTWNGIKDTVNYSKYIKPTNSTTMDFLNSITNLYDANYKFIVTPGYTFEGAIYEAQNKFKDATFLLLDGIPTNNNGESNISENTLCISFAEHEAGFLAGLASAVEIKEGQFGFIGGIEIPAVQKLNWGFQQGVNYANENLGTNIEIKEEHVIYQGTFTDVAAGQQIASHYLDNGVDVIFVAAGLTGSGALNEIKSRAMNGENVWAVGVDVDQYEEGIYQNGKSVILTSAMKHLDQAVYSTIKDFSEGKFEGGKINTFSIKNDGVGIPEINPNLSEKTLKEVDNVKGLIKTGIIEVKDNNCNNFLIK